MTMIRLNIHEAKTHLSLILDKLKKGETILLCKRNQPIPEIRPLPSPPDRKGPIGLAKGQLALSKDFFEPLPEEVVEAFQGEGQ